MADEVGRRGCSGLINLGISVVVLLLLGWFLTQDKFSISDLTKRIGNISGASPKIVLQTMPLVDSPTLTTSDVLVVSVKQDVRRRKNADNQYEIHLAYRSAANQITQWEVDLTTLYKDGHNYIKTTFDRDHVYIIIKDFLYALSRSKGERMWSLRLRDQLSPECTNCMALVERKLIVLTEDRILYAINPMKGNILRKNRLETPKAKGVGFYVIKDKIVLSDQVKDRPEISASIAVINPITLVPIRLFTPTPHREIDSGKVYKVNMPMVFDNIGSHIYLMPEGTHIQSWDIDNGIKKWDKQLPSRVLLPYKIQDLRSVEHQTSLYLQGSSGSRSVLLKVDMLSGKMQELAKEIDYALTPIVGRKNILITFAQKTRGTKKSELWGINHRTGMVAWRYPLRSVNLYNSQTNDGDVYHVMHKDGLLVIQYLKETGQMLIEKVNPMNGSLTKKTVKDVSGDKWNDIIVTKHKAYFSMDEVYELDLKTSEITRFDY